ncbi:CaiB/BaiF CoA transferase family protein [Psychrobacter sp. FDAARGOS_221]|uniref:CaiB/BaiF CoA transferase family protein n=1 Tax=Psychrobacter sp. FDAARGOS_221 TaxID=1975705 RepID=UPI000BB584E6|nr:CaiB/BaiF CoA-transferase family protein [Psychrobacter sp. FDAARGOS_221]PNK59845.1 CoA transferase [Psychrobacter sp. FDAARGOS_221]
MQSNQGQDTRSHSQQQPQSNQQQSTQALSGIKVLDLSRVLAGPSSTQILADLGAEVIKVERPVVGDETRQWRPPSFKDEQTGAETAAYFATVNRNKKSITVDITKPEGQQLLQQLAKQSDVVVENFKVGGLKKYGLDYETLKAINPKLIYASLTGFGQDGPDANKPGYDYIIQGLSGLMSITGPSDGEPHKVGVAVVDLFAGLQLTVGIQAALLARAKTGEGQYVDVALLDSAVAMLANIGMNQLASGNTPPRLGNAHPNITPYQVYATADDSHFILACGNDSQFAKVCQVIGQNLHQDSRYATNPERVANRDSLQQILVPIFKQKPREEWLELFQAAGVPCGPIHNVTEALAMPQVQARNMVVSFPDSPVRALGNPIKLSKTPVRYDSAPPALGADTQAVLEQLNLSAEQVQQLQDKGVI